ncbi:hypothetical protein K439DRAFT_1389508 [Ramaria rubella]|nr:hypothetical protein K439DRAFT_1389508 [Ramaria rubella]
MAFLLDKAELVSLLVEAVLYGLYVFLFACTIYVLIYKRSTPQIHYGMFTVTVSMFILATLHIIINLLRLMDAFNLSQTHPGAALTVLEDYSSFKNLFRSAVILAEIILGDVVLIYRCYVAWGGSFRAIILPLLVLCGTAVTSGGVVYGFSKSPSGVNIFKVKTLQSFIISTQVLVLMNNIICTGLLAWRLWSMSRAMVSRAQRHSLVAVARIIAESGLITAATWIIWTILNATHQYAQLIVLNALAPITGATFCLIVSRVALGVSSEAHKPTNDAVHHRGDEPSMSVLPVFDGTGRPHRPMEISVSSRESIRVENEMDILFKDKMSLAGLTLL